MSEKKIGTVSHYYNNIHVAAIDLTEGELKVGDRIHILGHTTDFVQPVRSMQHEHHFIGVGHTGESVGVKVIDHAREHDEVYKVIED